MATHNVVDGHEMPVSVEGAIFTGVLQAPLVGVLELTTYPPLPTAMQNSAEGQDTPSSALEETRTALSHALVAPAGFVEVATFPKISTSTHRLLDAHARPVA